MAFEKKFLNTLPVGTQFRINWCGTPFVLKIKNFRNLNKVDDWYITECIVIEGPKGITVNKLDMINHYEWEIEIIEPDDSSVLY